MRPALAHVPTVEPRKHYLFIVFNVHNDLAQTLLWRITADIVIDTVMMMFTVCGRFSSRNIIIVHLHAEDI